MLTTRRRRYFKEMRLQQLRGLCEIARQGSFSAAAAALRISRPAIWQQVRALEQEFDASLVDSEDWDWLLRLLLRHRAAFVAVPCVLFRQRRSGSQDALSYRRLAFMRRAFWRNVRRAGNRRPPVRDLLRMYARHNGNFAAHFLLSAKAHSAQGDAAGCRAALRGAFISSPLHATVGMAREPGLLGLAVRSCLPGPMGLQQ